MVIARLAINEDVGPGDHSSLAAVPATARKEAMIMAKEAGVIAGIDMAAVIFQLVDADLVLEIIKNDGEEVAAGDEVFRVSGKAQSILTAERTVLNVMQRMSGIATYTRKLVTMVAGTNARILDTRKTTPGLRVLEKWAVRIGGGTNHRFGLFDMIMLKDNHIDYAGSITSAIAATKNYLQENNLNLKIEVETRSLQEVKEVLESRGADIIMLDNMTPETMTEAIKIIDGRLQVEASGGITEKNLREIAECGVDYISIGALTHSVKSLDISLKAIK